MSDSAFSSAFGGGLRSISVGGIVPNASLAHLVGDELAVRAPHDLFKGKVVLLAGLPGAFTPVCSQRQLPDLIRNQAQLRRAGVEQIVCLTTNDPWVMRAWQSQTPGAEDFLFLSDSNLRFLGLAGLLTNAEHMFLGSCARRFVMVIRDLVVTRLKIDDDVLDFTCNSDFVLKDKF